MKIGFITGDLNHRHGWAHYSYEVVRALRDYGVNVTVVASSNTDFVDEIEIYPILPDLVPRTRFLLPKLLTRVLDVRKHLNDCDLIHCTVEPFAPLAALVCGQRPYIQGGVGSYLRIDRWQRFPMTALYRRAFEQSDRIVCISNYTEKIANKMFPSVMTEAIPLGIDPSRFESFPSLSVQKSGITIITVGGIKPRKGTLELVHAMAEVRQAIPEVQCLIIGNPAFDSAYTQQVMEAIKTLGLEKCIHIKGFVPEEELMAWYGAADLFVLPSINDDWIFEGYGLVHMEASAAGLPVIGTTNCGVEDAIIDGVTGILVNQDRIREELPRAMIDLLTDVEKRQRMGQAGRQHAQNQTWERVAREMVAVYEDVLRTS